MREDFTRERCNWVLVQHAWYPGTDLHLLPSCNNGAPAVGNSLKARSDQILEAWYCQMPSGVGQTTSRSEG
jgi:hypothetical protein